MSRERLAELRAAIEAADDALVAVLAQRAALVEEVWALKEALGLPRFDPEREESEKTRLLGQAKDLDEEALRRVLHHVIGNRLLRRR